MDFLRNDLLSTLISLCCQLKSNAFYWPWWLVNRDIWYYVCKHVLKCWWFFFTSGGNGFTKWNFPPAFWEGVLLFCLAIWFFIVVDPAISFWEFPDAKDWLAPNKNWQSNVNICSSLHSSKQKDENNMLQLYSDFCPNILKSTKHFISQYNHIACLIQFGLLHKMKWSSRTRSTEVQDHEEKATFQHQLWNSHPYSLTNYYIILNDTCRMSLKSFHCWHPIVVHRLQYTPTELCHVQSINNTMSGNHKSSSYATHSGLLHQNEMK